MDKLSNFLIDLTRATPVPAAEAPKFEIVEPTALEKRAYKLAFHSLGQDTDFLEKFEGTPLLPQAIALAEQELAMENRQLQRRVQRVATREAQPDYEQDCIEQDQVRLQKQQLMLELYKMKATTPPAQPGDATIGAPQEIPQTPTSPDPGMMVPKQASAIQPIAALGALGGAALGGVTGAASSDEGHRLRGALRGAAMGGVAGGAGGALAGHGLNVAAGGAGNMKQILDAVETGVAPLHVHRLAAQLDKNVAKAVPYAGAGLGITATGALGGGYLARSRAPQLGSEIGAGTTGNFAVPEQSPKQADVDIHALLKKYPGLNTEDTAHTELLELGGHPALPHEARAAILEKYLKSRNDAQMQTPEAALGEVKSQRAGTGAFYGGLAGIPVGTALAMLPLLRLPSGVQEAAAHPLLLTGAMAGSLGGALIGSGIGRATASQGEADKLLTSAGEHKAEIAKVLADPAMRERILGHLSTEHYKNQLRAIRHRDDEGAYDELTPDDIAGKKHAAIKKFARAKLANAMADIEGMIASRGASALRAVPTAAEGAMGHAMAAGASHGIPRNPAALLGEAGSGVRAIPKGPPPVPAQAKGLFAAPAVSPFAGTTPGAAPAFISPKLNPHGGTVAPMPPTSTQHVNYLAKQPGLGFAAPAAQPSTLAQSEAALPAFLRGKIAQAVRARLMKTAGAAERGYMGDAAKHLTPGNALAYGLPAISGGIHGAEQVPENRLLGALGGAAGGVGGSELGARTAEALVGHNMIGQLIGRAIGASAGMDLGARGARLLAT